ncbi:MAG: helix-turn-helix domain-containing protein [Pseudohongiellaceae bacterium]
MARPLRIEFPNAYYHVSNKADKTRGLFPAEQYYLAFLDGVREASVRFRVDLLGWCLLKNEYHLLVKTPEGNLSRFMRQVDGLYTQYYQKQRRKRGSVFRARYKSVLFEAERWLLPLSRHLHNLPRASRQNPSAWPWSSMQYYLATDSVPAHAVRNPGLQPEEVLAAFGSGAQARSAYANYLQAGNDRELSRFYGKKNQLSVLGDAHFRAHAKSLAAVTDVREVSQGALVRQRPSPGRIISSVADTFKVSGTSILHAARGPGSKNVPRWVAMYLCQEAGGITLQKIAQQFGLQRYGTVSTTIGKLKDEFEDDPPLMSRVELIRQQLSLEPVHELTP